MMASMSVRHCCLETAVHSVRAMFRVRAIVQLVGMVAQELEKTGKGMTQRDRFRHSAWPVTRRVTASDIALDREDSTAGVKNVNSRVPSEIPKRISDKSWNAPLLVRAYAIDLAAAHFGEVLWPQRG